jgi:hypothetical protein
MSRKDEAKGSSTFFFPLRTNAEFFALPQGYLSLLGRIKQASILYDSLLFEGGIYMATVGERGSVDMWIPPKDVTEEQLGVEFKSTGGEHYLRIRPTGSDQGHVLLSGSVERRFRSEFHSILTELEADYLPWIKMQTFSLSAEGKKLVERLRREDEENRDLALPEGSRRLQGKILANLNHDLVLIASLQTAASIDPLYAPLLRQKTLGRRRVQSAPGFLALQVAIPNFATLPWETIVEVREHSALAEFREKMISIELMAKSALPEGETEDLRYQVSQTITRELLREIAHLRPNLGEVAGDVILDLVLGLLPGPASATVTAFRGVMEVVGARQSWITAFLKLHTSSNNLLG